VVIVPSSLSPGAVQIKDGSGTATDIFAGGASSLTNLVPFTVPLGMKSKVGGWSIITLTGATAYGVGDFTAARRFFVRPGHASASDSHTSTQAQDPTTPMNTLAAALAYCERYRGDQILFAEGTTTAAGLPGSNALNGYSGFSAVYPFVIQTYDPTDALNEAKYGGATSGRPVINTGNNNQDLTGTTNDPPSGLAIRGFKWSPGNVSGPLISIFGSGGLASDYVLLENNILEYTQITGVGSSDGDLRGYGWVIRGNAIYGPWSATSNAHGMFISDIFGTIEDNVFYHTGWKIGATRDDDKSIGGVVGDEVFRHTIYQKMTCEMTIRRNLVAQPASTGFSSRGPQGTYHNVLLKCPIAINAGGDDSFNTIRPNGVLIDIGYNLCIGSEGPTTGTVRSGGINTANGRLGTEVHHNAIARSGRTSQSVLMATNSNYALPSYSHIHHNREHLFADSGNNFTISELGGASSIVTYDNNVSSDPTSGSNLNYLSDPPTTAYTEDSLAAAAGYTDYATMIAYAIAHPEAHVAQQLFTVGLTGYDIDVTAIATPVTLVNAALDTTTLHPGTPAEGFILGVMPGATLAATGVPSGMTLDLKRRYWRWDGTGSVSTPTIQFTQTLSTATNSGLVNNVGITIS
jgi:hypothetical protein